jgi:hypothetical protein
MNARQRSDAKPLNPAVKSWRDTIGALSHLTANYDGDLNNAIDQAVTDAMLEQETRALGRPPAKISKEELSCRLQESTAQTMAKKSRGAQ